VTSIDPWRWNRIEMNSEAVEAAALKDLDVSWEGELGDDLWKPIAG